MGQADRNNSQITCSSNSIFLPRSIIASTVGMCLQFSSRQSSAQTPHCSQALHEAQVLAGLTQIKMNQQACANRRNLLRDQLQS